jgi:hypothetical protein
VKGEDYFTDDEVEEVAKRAATHVKPGEDGEDGEDGAPGEKGEKGEPGEDGDDGKDGEKGDLGEKGEHGEDGDDGADGSPDSPEEVREKLHGLPKGSRLDYEKLDNTPDIGTIIARHVSSRSYSTDELIDVSMQGIVAGQVLQWDGKRFIPVTISAGLNFTQIFGEVLTMVGSTFTLAHTPKAGSVRLFRGGAYQTQVAIPPNPPDYTMVGAVGTVTTAPAAGEVFWADYNY